MPGRLKSVGHLQLILELEWGILLELLSGDLFLVGGIGLGLSLVLESYMSRRRGLHSLCIRSFSIIDVPWLLQLGVGHLLHLSGREFVEREVQLK